VIEGSGSRVRSVTFVLAFDLSSRVAQDETVVIPDESRSVLTCARWIVGFGSVELESRTKSKSTRRLTSRLSVELASTARCRTNSPKMRPSDRMRSGLMF
jgi:hypothetical protein